MSRRYQFLISYSLSSSLLDVKSVLLLCPSRVDQILFNMDFERQANVATMPPDQEDMKGFEVDGSIPTKYRGSAGKHWTLLSACYL